MFNKRNIIIYGMVIGIMFILRGVSFSADIGIPENLTAVGLSCSQINLSWEPLIDNVGLAGYKVYRDEKMIGTAIQANYSDSGLEKGKEYRYKVCAYDIFNNEGACSLEISVATGMSTGPVYYVSCASVSTDWQAAKNKFNPCTPKTATENIQAGETVYFLAGKYDVREWNLQDPRYMHPSYHSYFCLRHSGMPECPIVIAVYPGSIVVMNGIESSGDDQVRVFSTIDNDYIVFDGFIIQADDGKKIGSLIIGYDICDYSWKKNSKGCIIRNCVFNGGSGIIQSTDNRECLRIEWTVDTLVQNCKIYNCCHQTDNHNTSGIKMYHNKNTVIEHCEAYNCSLGIFDKSDGQGSVYRYNYIHNCIRGLLFTGYAWTGFESSHPDCQVYHNIFNNIERDSIVDTTQEWSTSHRLKIYNNTLYAADGYKVGIFLGAGNQKEVYNNIINGPPVDFDLCKLSFWDNNYFSCEIAGCDHNQFGDLPDKFCIKVSKKNAQGIMKYITYRKLLDWQLSGNLFDGGNPGEGSLVSDPKFINISGNMSQIEDFGFQDDSPCKGAGRNGTDIGADISLVGIKEIIYSFGDINNDGGVNVFDVQACVNHVLGLQDWGQTADVNNNGNVDVLDVQAIVNIILGKL